MWGTQWTPAQVNASNFGVAFAARHDNIGTNATARVDGISITVHYATSTTTTLVSSQNPSGAGQSVTFTATVAGSSPTGTVQFFVDGSSVGNVALSGGTASYTTSALSTGTTDIDATYNGDANNNTSNSNTVTQDVDALVSVTAATGGSAIASSTVVGGSATSLTGPTIAETDAGQIGLGTIALNAHAGFAFQAGTVNANVSLNNSVLCGIFFGLGARPLTLSSSTAVVTSNTITVTVSQKSVGGSCMGSIAFTGIKVRLTAAAPLASGNMTRNGTS